MARVAQSEGTMSCMLRKIGAAAFALAVAGCSTVKDAYMVDSVTKDPDSELLSDSSLLRSGQFVPPAFDVYITPFPGDLAPTTGVSPSNKAAAIVTPASLLCTRQEDRRFRTKDGLECRSAYVYAVTSTDSSGRNNLQAFLTRRSDDICHTHESGIISVGAENNFGLSEVTTILGGVGALLTPAAASRALAGAAGMVNATRDNVNQVFFQNLLASAIVKSIDANRTTRRVQLEANAAKTTSEYSVDQMLSAVVDYHSLCSFYAGLASLTNAAARTTPSTDELTGRVTVLQKQKDDDLKSIEKLSAQTFTADQDAAKQVRDRTLASLQTTVAGLEAQIGLIQVQIGFVPSSGGAPPVGGAPAPAPASGVQSPAAGSQVAAPTNN